MCLLPAYVKHACKSPVTSFLPLPSHQRHDFRLFFFFSSLNPCPVLILLFRTNLSTTVHCSTCSTQSHTQTHSSYSWRNAPALQIIVWFAGSVTNYWRMIVVYGFAQRLRPRVISRNRGIVTPRAGGLSLGRHLHALWDTTGDLQANWPWPKTIIMRLASFVHPNGSQLPLSVTSTAWGHQQGLLSRFYKCYPTQLPLQQVTTCRWCQIFKCLYVIPSFRMMWIRIKRRKSWLRYKLHKRNGWY